MKQLPYSIGIILFLLFTSDYAIAQPKGTKHNASIYIKARAQRDRVLLRWAVSDPAAWKLANKYGYRLERFTVLQSGRVNNSPDKKIFTPAPLKPAPVEQWSIAIQNNDDAAIIAQSLYGESFSVSGGESNLAKIVSQNDELNQRYTFSLLAADRDFNASLLAGWGFIDSTVKPGEKYLYRIYTAVPRSQLRIDTAGAYTGLADYEPLPKPKDLYAVYGDRSVLLSWNYKLLRDFYSTYFIERSEDGKSFSRISDLPVANLNERDDHTPSRMFYTDTLKDNNKTYYYRIAGLSSFGETGPPSDTVSGSGKQALAYVPNITQADIQNDSTVLLRWEFPYIGERLIDHFELRLSADAAEKSFKTVKQHIPVGERRTQFTRLQPVNYFSVAAIDKNGNERSSFPYLVQPVDSIPPAVPSGLTVVIDTSGNVTLKWNANTESDVLGYTILKGNLKQEEAAVINSEPFAQNIFKEKISLKTLNDKVYYSVIALDKRMNQSVASVPVELIKPDRIPPVNPVFTNYEVTDDGIVRLRWIKSPSADVVKYAIYRKMQKDGQWLPVGLVEDKFAASYEDTQAPADELLAYTITATDRSNNESEPAPPLTLSVRSKTKVPVIKKLTAEINKPSNSVLISWSLDNQEVAEYTIYRAVNKAALTTWHVVNADQTSIEDKGLAVSNEYRYAVRATMKDGRMSGLKEVKVEY